MNDRAPRMPVSVYRIDLTLYDSDSSFDEVVDTIIGKANADGASLKPELLQQDLDSRFYIQIFTSYKTPAPKWTGFIGQAVDASSAIHDALNTVHFFVAFIGFKNCLFALTGGGANSIIERFIDQNFGLDLITKLFKKDDQVIKSVQNRGLTGIVLGQTKFYRGDQRLSDENQFGKIFKRVQAELNKKILTNSLGFTNEDIKRDSFLCQAKSSFQIGKSLDFKATLKLVERLTQIIDLPANFSLNKVEVLTPRKHNHLIIELQKAFEKKLFEDYKKNDLQNVDVCNKDFERYLTNSTYEIEVGDNFVVTFDNPPTYEEIIRKLRNENAIDDSDLVTFKASMLWRGIRSFNLEGEDSTNGTILDHLHCELEYDGYHYFFLDAEWYRIHPDFVRDLDKECTSILKRTWNTSLISERFNINKTEHAFNTSFVGKPNWLVFDTITPDNIEPCDLLRYETDAVYFVHVKKGFNNSMRDLSSQVIIAAKRIHQDIKSDFEYLDKVELKTKKGKKTPKRLGDNPLSSQVFPLGGLKQLIRTKSDKQIVFCLAFVDHPSTAARSLKDNISSFKSNIAKFALLEAHQEVRALGFDFQVIQLGKSVS